MAFLKFGVGAVYGSQALMVGALYSVNDVLSSFAVNISLRMSRRGPNAQYPWGYEKAEFLATGLTGAVLLMAVTGVAIYQFNDLIAWTSAAPPHITALGVAILSIFVSGYMHQRADRLAHELSSPALHTTSEHSKADAISSVAILIGVGAATLGFQIIDKIVAIFEIGHIYLLAGEFLFKATKGLMDASLPEEDVELIRDACAAVPGVKRIAAVRTRKGIRRCWVDVVVVVSGELTVGEAQHLTEDAAEAVRGVLGPAAETSIKFQGAKTPYAGLPRDA